MLTCEIKWIDKSGNPTPDSNPATCMVWLPKRVMQIGGRGISMDESQHYACCAEHAKRLAEPGMEQWQCEPVQS